VYSYTDYIIKGVGSVGILQLEFYEEATAEEIKQAKSLLTRYRRYKAIIAELESMELAPKQLKAYNAYVNATTNIERTVRLILDSEVRKIIERRYIKGDAHYLIVQYFQSSFHPSTIDRKLNEGIESVANSLKIFDC
jgi:hypothetical protein